MQQLHVNLIGCLVAAVALALPAQAAASVYDPSRPDTAYPGTLNYVEGQASIGSETLSSKSIGKVQLQPGQSLTTQDGKAEILLTPGVFLRVGDDSSVKMVSPSLTDTDAELNKGQAMVEVTEIHRENRIRVGEDGAITQLLKTGLYDFNANQGTVRVFDGQAMVQVDDHDIKVGGSHEVNLNAAKIKSRSFDKKKYESSSLYQWSSLRSAYLAEANADLAPAYIINGWYGPGWIGSGWYWDPWFGCYTFLPGDGIFYGPFGFGFYSPFFAYGYYGGFAGPHYYHTFGLDPHEWGPRLSHGPTFRSGHLAPAASLRGNPRGFTPRGGLHGVSGFRGGHFGGGFPGGGFHGGAVSHGPGH
jgi:FecR protein